MKTERSSFSAAASPGAVGDDLDRHPQRPERVGKGARAGSGGERRGAEAARGHGPEQRHVGEARACPSTSAASSRLSSGAAVFRSA